MMEQRRTVLRTVEIGTKVKVRESSRVPPGLHGKIGLIQARYGVPDYMAFDVLLERGISHLFWQHELEEAGDHPA